MAITKQTIECARCEKVLKLRYDGVIDYAKQYHDAGWRTSQGFYDYCPCCHDDWQRSLLIDKYYKYRRAGKHWEASDG